MRYSNSLGLRNELWSNGTTLTNRNIESILKYCDRFVLHLDTINPDRFNLVQDCKKIIKQNHQRILKGFDNLLARGFPSSDIRINITLARRTLPDLESTMKYFVTDRGVQTAILIPLFATGRGRQASETEFLSTEELYHAFKKRAEIENRPELILLGTSEFCKQYQLTTAYITAKGEIIPYAGINTPVGNIYSDDLRLVLENSFDKLSFAEMVNDTGERNRIKGHCGICENSRYCFGTRANSFFTTGSLSNSDLSCWKNK